MSIDIKQLGASLSGQFENLNGRHPGQWPIVPRVLCGIGVVVGVVALGYFTYLSAQFEEQALKAGEEVKLREEYRGKMAQAINLEALIEQKRLVDQYVDRLQKQLPSKAEMDELLSDINQAAVGRGLQFALFKPEPPVVKDYYAEQPIDIKVTGSYHDIGAFAGDIANLPRIVTLNNMSLTAKDGVLLLEALAKTFRYLDPEEVNAQREAKAAAAAKAGPAKKDNKP
ncbi:type 4a pilus biogenesis protein PilO [Massilia glaciei]|uniref:Pilus assembly protein PilO n=1 Tax=Massilia glaciei TaxID=1524097 RepID=A0A2U2I5C7_9BURK|nr:type 4a pilus biogenesis protein PilO [Massilia glaciei]PWF54839.1 pilus assembly protein PilO [Massilia glaciei]